MARGRKSAKSISEQIAEIDQQVEQLKKKRRELLLRQEKEAVSQLLEAAKSAGKTPVELVEELTMKRERS